MAKKATAKPPRPAKCVFCGERGAKKDFERVKNGKYLCLDESACWWRHGRQGKNS